MSIRRVVAAVTAILLAGVLAPALAAAPASAAPNCDLGGFEIDGNKPSDCDPEHDDWDTIFKNQANGGRTYNPTSHDTADPSTWTASSDPSDKSDLAVVFSSTRVTDDDHYYLYAGWTRESATGAGLYAVEVTFADGNVVAGVPQPNRSQGGVVAYVAYDGANVPTLDQICPYAAQATYPDSVDAGDPPCTSDTTGFASGVSADGLFVEVGFDLTELSGTEASCPPTHDAASVYVRGITGDDTAGDLKALADPISVFPPSTSPAEDGVMGRHRGQRPDQVRLHGQVRGGCRAHGRPRSQ